MRADSPPELAQLLSVLPKTCQQRLQNLGFFEPESPAASPSTSAISAPERSLRRVLGGPQPVSLVDLELEAEQFHARFISTAGPLALHQLPHRTACVGRIWLDLALMRRAGQPLRASWLNSRVRVAGILLADPALRSEHQARQLQPGGYGPRGLFIAQLLAVSITPELSPYA